MSKSIYVGNLPWSSTEEQVRDLFAEYGNVHSVKLVNDRETGRARGFGFVEMDDAAAEASRQRSQTPRPPSAPLLRRKDCPEALPSGFFSTP